MMKWLVLAIVVAAVLFGLRKYSMDDATDEDSFAAGIYGKRIEKDLLEICNATIMRDQTGDETTPAQYASTCKCFADDMTEKLRAVPPDEMQAHLQKNATRKNVQTIVKKCGYAAGLH